MTVEIITEGEGHRVVGHQRVGLIAGLQLAELAAHLIAVAAAGNNKGQDKANRYGQMSKGSHRCCKGTQLFSITARLWR